MKFVLVFCLTYVALLSGYGTALGNYNDTETTCLRDIVTVESGGRLGNRIFEYLSVWSLATLHNKIPLIPDIIFKSLNEGFENLSVQTIKSYMKQKGSACEPYLDEKTIFARKEDTSVRRMLKRSRETGSPIILGKYIVLESTIAPMRKKIKDELKFREEFRDSAQNILNGFRSRVANMTGGKRKVVFVGVHLRRTDYMEYLERKFNINGTANPSYYRRAMLWMRKELFNNHRKQPVDVIFVVVSDDIEWCIKHLIPKMLKDSGKSAHLGSYLVFPASEGEMLSPLHDLALLSACNHTIMSYGTFGMSGALLAGGITVVYDVTDNPSNTHLKGDPYAIGTLKFARRLKKWIAMH